MKTKFILLATTALMLAACGNRAQKQSTDEVQTETATSSIDLTTLPEEPIIELQTSLGTMKIKLYKDTPQHRDNMLKLINEGFYNGILFHRVIKDFMIQAGDPESKGAAAGIALGSGGPGYTVPAEIKFPQYYHKRGALSAARTRDEVNPERMSSGSQFYIVQGTIATDEMLNAVENQNGIKYTTPQRNDYKTIGGVPRLDGAYTVFGELVSGFDVLDAIAATQTGERDRPTTDVVIIKASIITE